MIIEATNIWLGLLMLMGEGLQLAAGDRMRRLLETFTKNLFRGVLAGTTVMLAGFVNAGRSKWGQVSKIEFLPIIYQSAEICNYQYMEGNSIFET